MLRIIIFIVLAAGIIVLAVFYKPTAPAVSPTPTENTMNQNQLGIDDLVIGTGVEAKNGSTVTVHYVGTLLDGTKFDSSRDRGTPFTFTIGAGQVIAGWEQGISGMKVGGKRRLKIPPDLAYGNQAVGGVIPANSTLLFE